jgi:acetyl-CoA carboxylase, biotin carboxylase subunit
MIKKVLIANRGEIAVRIIRACRALDIKSVAVYSEVDKNALHVQLADEVYCIGPASPLESYLNVDKIIETARKSGADAIHPGYGFLAENHNFAARCEKEGLIFVGPPSEAIRKMGNKVESRTLMKKSGVPIVPGTDSSNLPFDEVAKFAAKAGYPVLVKAAAGGGGKGMRIVESEDKLKSSLEAAMREAKGAFSDESVYIEKYLKKPRHVEFQVLADSHGNIVYLFERECSIQRRHQKIVEETPSVIVDPVMREKMGKAAVNAALAVGYVNAGTVEFLVDENKNFYFLEMNTRIQVEHPITEMVVGVDLVKWQLKIASGEELTFKQDNLSQRGHSIECRIYAEDPVNNFLPSPGKILFQKEPSGPGVRLDNGIFSGYEVTPNYDPILSKLVVWDENRDSAIKRMIDALDDYVILGVKTTISFLRDVMLHPEFVKGNTTTDFIDKNLKGKPKVEHKELIDLSLVAAALSESTLKRGMTSGATITGLPTPWETIGKWEIGT